jgi:hypothetical protein
MGHRAKPFSLERQAVLTHRCGEVRPDNAFVLIEWHPATYVSLPMGATAVFPAIFGLLLAFVAYGRFRLRPIKPKDSESAG